MVDDLVRLTSHHPEMSRGLDLYTNVELIGKPPALSGSGLYLRVMHGSLEKCPSCHFSVKAGGFYTSFHCRDCCLSTQGHASTVHVSPKPFLLRTCTGHILRKIYGHYTCRFLKNRKRPACLMTHKMFFQKWRANTYEKFQRNSLEPNMTQYKRFRNYKKKQTDMYRNTTFLAGHRCKYMHYVVSDPKKRCPSGHAIKLPNFRHFAQLLLGKSIYSLDDLQV